jgi:nitroreductase
MPHSSLMNLQLTADEVLTTTRAVRKRLDLERPVPRAVLLECLQIAVQAPTGSNRQGWHWVFVEDPSKKAVIADHYRATWEGYAKTRLSEFPDDDPRTRQRPGVLSSAQYLADNLHRVPVMMIPLIEGRLDQGPVVAQAGAWGSILPAVWSYLLALRSRGIGSAWTTLHLPYEKEVAELLGVPYDRYTQAGLFPIAYTKGTDFKPAARLPLDEIVHFDAW